MRSLFHRVIFVMDFLIFITLSISCHSLLACRVSVERSAVSLIGVPLCVICWFALAAFNICSLCLIFVSLVNMCLGVFLLVYPVWDSLGLLDLGGYFLSHVKDAFDYNLLKYFLTPFLFVYFFWDPYNSNVGAFNVVPAVSETVSISFYYVLLCSVSVISTLLSSSSLICSSASVFLVLVPSSVFLISVTVLFGFPGWH